MHCILCGQYILADRFLRNSGYLFECEMLLNFGCHFPSRRDFEKSNNTEDCLNLTLTWPRGSAFIDFSFGSALEHREFFSFGFCLIKNSKQPIKDPKVNGHRPQIISDVHCGSVLIDFFHSDQSFKDSKVNYDRP